MIAATPPAAPDFDRLVPRAADYAHRPIEEAFDWAAVTAGAPAAEWYLVVFRSVRRADADEAALVWYDERAHEEAMTAPGFVHYFKGPLGEDRSCLSFCLWSDRGAARAASAEPLHRAAVTLTAASYERYGLETYRVMVVPGVAMPTFEPIERAG